MAFVQRYLPFLVKHTTHSNATKVRKLICEESEN